MAHGDISFDRESNDQPYAEEAGDVTDVNERLTPAVHVEYEHPDVAEPHCEQLQQKAGVGDCQRCQVYACGQLPKVREYEYNEGADIADQSDNDDGRRDVQVYVPKNGPEQRSGFSEFGAERRIGGVVRKW